MKVLRSRECHCESAYLELTALMAFLKDLVTMLHSLSPESVKGQLGWFLKMFWNLAIIIIPQRNTWDRNFSSPLCSSSSLSLYYAMISHPCWNPPLFFFPNFSIFLEISFHGKQTSIHCQPHYWTGNLHTAFFQTWFFIENITSLAGKPEGRLLLFLVPVPLSRWVSCSPGYSC